MLVSLFATSRIFSGHWFHFAIRSMSFHEPNRFHSLLLIPGHQYRAEYILEDSTESVAPRLVPYVILVQWFMPMHRCGKWFMSFWFGRNSACKMCCEISQSTVLILQDWCSFLLIMPSRKNWSIQNTRTKTHTAQPWPGDCKWYTVLLHHTELGCLCEWCEFTWPRDSSTFWSATMAGGVLCDLVPALCASWAHLCTAFCKVRKCSPAEMACSFCIACLQRLGRIDLEITEIATLQHLFFNTSMVRKICCWNLWVESCQCPHSCAQYMTWCFSHRYASSKLQFAKMDLGRWPRIAKEFNIHTGGVSRIYRKCPQLFILDGAITWAVAWHWGILKNNQRFIPSNEWNLICEKGFCEVLHAPCMGNCFWKWVTVRIFCKFVLLLVTVKKSAWELVSEVPNLLLFQEEL